LFYLRAYELESNGQEENVSRAVCAGYANLTGCYRHSEEIKMTGSESGRKSYVFYRDDATFRWIK